MTTHNISTVKLDPSIMIAVQQLMDRVNADHMHLYGSLSTEVLVNHGERFSDCDTVVKLNCRFALPDVCERYDIFFTDEHIELCGETLKTSRKGECIGYKHLPFFLGRNDIDSLEEFIKEKWLSWSRRAGNTP